MTPQVFVCYARKDVAYCDQLRTRLMPYQDNGIIRAFIDAGIPEGDNWPAAIDAALASAEVGVLLVSPDWLASTFIRQTEVPRLFGRHARGEVTLHVVLVRPTSLDPDGLPRVDGRPIPLAELQWLARKGDRTISELSGHEADAAWNLVGEKLKLSAKARPLIDQARPRLGRATAAQLRQIAEDIAPGADFTSSEDPQQALRVQLERLLDLPEGDAKVAAYLGRLGRGGGAAPVRATKPRLRVRLEPVPQRDEWRLDAWRLDGGLVPLCSRTLAVDQLADTFEHLVDAAGAQPDNIDHVELIAPVLERGLGHRCWCADPVGLGPERVEESCAVHLRPLERYLPDKVGRILHTAYVQRAASWQGGQGTLVRLDPGAEDSVRASQDVGAQIDGVPDSGSPRRLRLLSVLRFGLPVLLWSTQGTAPELAPAQDTPLRDLPHRLRKHEPDALTLLYDDPDSSITPDELRS